MSIHCLRTNESLKFQSVALGLWAALFSDIASLAFHGIPVAIVLGIWQTAALSCRNGHDHDVQRFHLITPLSIGVRCEGRGLPT